MPDMLAGWTAQAVRALPEDGQRYETVDGALLVTPAPSYAHQYAIAGLYERLAPFVRQYGIGAVTLSPADVELDPRTLVQPDLFVARLVEGRRPQSWAEVGVPLLVVEVLSPSTARADRHTKRRRYQRAGVPEYWILDLDARLVERWRPGEERPEIVADRFVWQPVEALAALELELPALFSEALGMDA